MRRGVWGGGSQLGVETRLGQVDSTILQHNNTGAWETL